MLQPKASINAATGVMQVTSEAHPQHLALGELLKRVSLDKNVPIAQYAEQLTDKGYRVPLDIFEADTIDISSDTGLLSAIARRIKRAVVRHLQGRSCSTHTAAPSAKCQCMQLPRLPKHTCM